MITISRQSYFCFLVAGVLSLFGLVPAYSQQRIALVDGQVLTGRLVNFRGQNATWADQRAGNIPIPLARIRQVEYTKEPEFWSNVLELLKKGDYSAAESEFKRISLLKSVETLYPLPGNLSTLASRRLLDVYLQTGDWAQFKYIHGLMEWEKLPPLERRRKPILDIWAVVGAKDFEGAIERADRLEKVQPAAATELSYLRAVAYKGLKNFDESVLAFAEFFGPYAGKDRNRARSALIECTEMIAPDPLRQAELKALIHTYAALYGDGKLWSGAPALYQKLLKEQLKESGPAESRSQAAEQNIQSSSTIEARFVRLVQRGEVPEGLRVGEIEVLQAGYNIAPKGSASVSTPAPRYDASFVNDGKDDTRSAGTPPGRDPWVEIDLKELQKIDSIKIRAAFDIATTGPGDTLKSFDVILMDGNRKELFVVRNQPTPKPELEIPVSKPN